MDALTAIARELYQAQTLAWTGAAWNWDEACERTREKFLAHARKGTKPVMKPRRGVFLPPELLAGKSRVDAGIALARARREAYDRDPDKYREMKQDATLYPEEK